MASPQPYLAPHLNPAYCRIIHLFRSDPDSEEGFRILGDMLKHVCNRICIHSRSADMGDIMQSAYADMLASIRADRIRDPASIFQYARVLVEQTIWRRNKATHLHSKIALMPDCGVHLRGWARMPHTDELTHLHEREKAIAALFETLTERERDILNRFYVLEQTKEQIMAEMGWNSTQFRLRKSRAKAHLTQEAKALGLN